MRRLVRIANISVDSTVAENCQGNSVMSENNTASYASAGTPFGVPFFAFARFIDFAFYGFYYYFVKNRIAAPHPQQNKDCA